MIIEQQIDQLPMQGSDEDTRRVIIIHNIQQYMIRDKNQYLKAFKASSNITTSLSQAPIWADQYQQYKDLLHHVQADNQKIASQIQSYKNNTTVYIYKQISTQLNNIDRNIKKIETWAQTIATLETSPEETKVMKNISQSILEQLTQEIKIFNSNKLLFITIDRQSQAMQKPHNQSYNSHNSSFQQSVLQVAPEKRNPINFNVYQALQKQKDFQFVSGDIHQVHNLIGRMGTQVHAQGQVIDRIDYNLMEAQDNMSKGNKELRSRLHHQDDSQQNESEWNIYSRVNKAIMFFYILNIVLIVIWFIKHL